MRVINVEDLCPKIVTVSTKDNDYDNDYETREFIYFSTYYADLQSIFEITNNGLIPLSGEEYDDVHISIKIFCENRGLMD